MYCPGIKRLLRGRVMETMGTEGQRKLCTIVTYAVKGGVSMRVYAMLHAGTQTKSFQPGKSLFCDC